MVNEGPLILFEGRPFLSLDMSPSGKCLELSLVLEDEHGRVLAMIERNEWISGDTDLWDIKAAYQTLRIQSRERKINLEIDISFAPIQLRADLWHNKKRVSVGRNGISFGTSRDLIVFQGMTFVGKSFSLNKCDEVEPGVTEVELEFVNNPTLKTDGLMQVGQPLEVSIEAYKGLKKT